MTPLIHFTLFWLAGLGLAQWLAPPPMALALAALPVIGGLLLYRNAPPARRRFGRGLALLLGAARLLSAQPAVGPGHIAFYNETDYLLLTGVVINEPDIRDTYTNLRVRAETIAPPDGTAAPVTGLALVRAPRFPEYHYGDRLEIFAKPETPPVFESFSYKDYLARQNIHTLMRRPKIRLIAPQSGFSLKAAIYRFKARAHSVINRILVEPEAALLNGILLGIQSGIPPALYEDFNATGASHVIVISGSNISLLVGILLLAGQKLIGKRRAAWLAMLGVALYTVMVGADAAVVRAALMGALFVLAMVVGRPNGALNALFAAALAMTAINPLTLWDVGFQLSFAATLGLVLLVPALERGSAKLLGQFSGFGGLSSTAGLLNEALLVTVAAQITTTPLILYQFGRLSLVSLLTNLLIVPVQPLIMLLGGPATLAGMAWLPLGQALGWPAWLLLTWTIRIVQWTAGFKWAQIALPAMPFWLMALFYLTLAAGLWWFQTRPPAQNAPFSRKSAPAPAPVYAFGGLLALGLLLWVGLSALPDGKLHVAFLDVGQGDAILVTTPRGRQMLIDGGPSPAQLGQQLGREMPFWDHSIDIIVNTHPDADHLTGLVDVLTRYRVDTVLVNGVPGASGLYREWARRLETTPAEVISARQGMVLQLDDGVRAKILNPGPASAGLEEINDQSVTLRLSLGQVSFLFSGDLEAAGEAALLASGQNVRATVFKSPHHGSKTGSSPPFLQAVQPQVIVISVGADNRFGHPAPEVTARYTELGAVVFRTDQTGAVELVTDGHRLWRGN